MVKITKKGFIIHSLDKNLTTWNKMPGSLSSSIIQKLRDSFLFTTNICILAYGDPFTLR